MTGRRAPTVDLPADTDAGRRALAERRCIELSVRAYDVAAVVALGPAGFVHPQGAVSPELVGLGVVEDGCAYLAFRGTATFRNGLVDATVLPSGRPRRHRGFDRAWRLLRPQVHAWLSSVRPDRLILTGHSLGGAIAHLAAMELAAAWPIEQVVTFGAPLVGWRTFADAFDATPIAGREGRALGAVTTTYVFRSDLVRTLLLPSLGYRRHGSEITIDEAGRPIATASPWYVDALDTASSRVQAAWTTVAGEEPGAAPRPGAWRAGGPTPASEILDVVRPSVRALLAPFGGYVAAAGLAAGAAMAAFFSARFLRRDASYHSSQGRYAAAMAERMARWLPVAHEERAARALVAGEADVAVLELAAALAATEAEARGAGVQEHDLYRVTWHLAVRLAAAHARAGQLTAAASVLSRIVDASPSGIVEVPVDAAGTPSESPRMAALVQRAPVFERLGRSADALADYTLVLGARASQGFDAFVAMRDRARRTCRVDGRLSSAANLLVGYRRRAVDEETARLSAECERAFQRAMAPIWQWAHRRAAACALALADDSAIEQHASAALALDARDAMAWLLRGSARGRSGRPVEAVADITAALALDPDNAEAYHARGMARLEAAIAERAPGADAARDTVEIRIRGDAAARALAVADFRAALDRDPGHTKAALLLRALTGD